MKLYSNFTVDQFKNRLRDFREQRQMSQNDLAKAIGTTPASISAYENGLRNPKCEIYCALANALRKDPAEFFLTDEAISILEQADSDRIISDSFRYSSNQDIKTEVISNIYKDLTLLSEDELKAIRTIVSSMANGK